MIRRNVFWLADTIKGGNIRKALDEISLINSNPLSDKSLQLKKVYIQNLLLHAAYTTRFYKNVAAGSSIKDFPVINKNTIRDNYDNFTSNAYPLHKLKKISTSGSTGIPFTIHQCNNKKTRNYADNLYFSDISGYHIGNPLYYLRIWNTVNKRNKFYYFKQNTIPVDISDMSEKASDHLLNILNKIPSNAAILAYGSTYEIIASHIENRSLKVTSRPKVALVMSDPLNYKTKQFLFEKFGCPFLSRYSNAENGFLGHQWSMDTEDYMINTASYYIELLEFDSDKEVRDGKPGRVVVSDLFNYAVPIIRYDTGDMAIKGTSVFNGITIPVFKSIEGRRLDFIFNTKGDFISPHSIDYALRNMPGLEQFQIIQKTSGTYTLKLQVKEKGSHIEKEAKLRLEKYLGDKARIEVVFTHDIPVTNSGKRRLVINEMNQ